MKQTVLIILLFLGFQVNAQKPSIDEVRSLYAQAEASEEAGEELIELLSSYEESAPLLLAYRASGTMMMAKHVINPFKKMSYFKKGKNLLQRAVDADGENVEIRFLRFAIQSNTPGFLGYKDKMEEDKDFLLRTAPQVKDENLKKLILPFLKNSDYLTENEKQNLGT